MKSQNSTDFAEFRRTWRRRLQLNHGSSRGWGRNSTGGMTATLVAFHIAAHAESLATAGVGAAEGFLARVGVGVDA